MAVVASLVRYPGRADLAIAAAEGAAGAEGVAATVRRWLLEDSLTGQTEAQAQIGWWVVAGQSQ